MLECVLHFGPCAFGIVIKVTTVARLQNYELQQLRQALDAANEQLEAFYSQGAQLNAQPAYPHSVWVLQDWDDKENGVTRLHDPETQLLFSQSGPFSDWPSVVGRLDVTNKVASANIVVRALDDLNSARKTGQLDR